MKKGFTLIELLAVIVILAIIALIATPIILGVVENARKSAAGSSALGYIDAVEKEIALGDFKEKVYPTGEIDIKKESPYDEIEVQGSKPTEGTLYIFDDYRIEAATLCVNDYRVDLLDYKIDSIEKGCDDMSAKFLIDYSGNGNHGYLQGATRNEASVTTDGVDDYVYAGLAGYEFKNELALVFRFKLLDGINGLSNLFSNFEGAGFGYWFNGNKKLQLSINTQSEGCAVISDKEYNEFNTLAMVWDKEKVRLYVNGSEVQSVACTNAIKNSADPFLIGANPQQCDNINHTCTIIEGAKLEFTDALIFDRALSGEEIEKDFSGLITKVSNKSGLLLRYDLDN